MSRVIYESEKRITNGYSSSHRGVDLGWRTNEGENVIYPNCKGKVIEVVTGRPHNPNATGVASWGNYVLIQHENGYTTRYAHLREVYTRVGETVDENTSIGLMGESGNANGRHLHFEVSTSTSSRDRINPTPYLTRAVYTPPKEDEHGNDFKVGDRVIVSGYATSDSNGGGSRTATYNGTTDMLYITKITDKTKPRPYHISRGPVFGNQNRGWVAKSQIKKA